MLDTERPQAAVFGTLGRHSCRRLLNQHFYTREQSVGYAFGHIHSTSAILVRSPGTYEHPELGLRLKSFRKRL